MLVGNGITLLLLGIVGTGSDFVATHPHHADNVASGKHVRSLTQPFLLLIQLCQAISRAMSCGS